MIQEAPNQYDVIEGAPNNADNTLEQLKPWEERVDKKDEERVGFLSSVLNPDRLKIYPSDQIPESWNPSNDIADLRKGVADNREAIKRLAAYLDIRGGLENRLSDEVLGVEGIKNQMEYLGYLTNPWNSGKRIFSGSQIEPYKA